MNAYDVVGIEFLSENTGVEAKLTHKHALQAVRSRLDHAIPPLPVLEGDDTSPPSVEKVRSNLRDLCKLVLTY